MERFSKFKVLTIAFLLMFVFVIAAIYTNTKDVTESKMKINQQSQNESIESQTQKEQSNSNFDSNSDYRLNEMSSRIDDLASRIDNLQNNTSQNGSGMNCKIEGILSDGNIVPISSEEALQEARVNNKEVVMTCSFR